MTLPAILFYPSSHWICLSRSEQAAAAVTTSLLCYSAQEPSPAPPPPPPPYEPTLRSVVAGSFNESTGVVLLPFLNCTEFLPGVFAVSVEVAIQLDKAGGGSGSAVITTDTTAPFDCADGAVTTGSLTMTSLGLSHDEDGDGCTDWNELGEDVSQGGLNDPFNPDDCGVPGLYDVSQPFSIGYRFCKAHVQSSYDTRVFCYLDGPWVVNQLGYAPPAWYIAVTGDGIPGGRLDGGGPWWPAIPVACVPAGCTPVFADSEMNCLRFGGADEDGDTVVNDGCPSEGFADVDSSHTELAGTLDTGTSTLRLAGCFVDEDSSEALGNIYVEWSWNVHTGAGTSDTWTGQTDGNCTGTHAWGAYEDDTGIAPPPVFHNVPLAALKRPNTLAGQDSDGDGSPDIVELRDNGATDCGLRDPFNPYDWYDVNQDGVIDLANDILGVINLWNSVPGGAPPYDVDYDRPPTMIGAIGHWNRGAPDGVIDLVNDILGVIDQWHPLPC